MIDTAHDVHTSRSRRCATAPRSASVTPVTCSPMSRSRRTVAGALQRLLEELEKAAADDRHEEVLAKLAGQVGACHDETLAYLANRD